MNEPFATHEVLNQSPPFEDVNLFTTDRALTEAVNREGGGAAVKRLTAFGAVCGSAAAFERGRLANDNPPRLKPFDSKGRRLDVVEFHPAYHELHGDQRRRGPALLGLGPSGSVGGGAGRQAGARAPTSRARPAATWRSRWRPGISARSP